MARTTTPRIRIRKLRVAGLVIAVAAIAGALGDRLPASSSSPAASPGDGPRREHRGPPRVANLDPALRQALRRAQSAAAADGIELVVTSGWRSPEEQAQLLREAVSEYGSEEEAARWVATPDTSAHVSGDAIDVGPSDAAQWLSARGAAFGLCPVYGNEPWHYELRPAAVDRGCPPMYPDPTYDPRMQT